MLRSKENNKSWQGGGRLLGRKGQLPLFYGGREASLGSNISDESLL